MDNKQVIHGKYFPHIDGIRTIAVLSVVIYHIFGNLCPGGFVGVDIFFVISGYLITGGILKSLDQGKFSLKDFYERRIRRIIPAYVVLIAFVMLCCLILPSKLMNWTLASSASSSVFSTNILLYLRTGGYFDLNSETNPLLHLWSLSVEEQFYIFTPLFLFLVYKINKKLILSSLFVVTGLSLAFSLYCNYHGDNHFNFYMLPTRTWELMAGSLFAYWHKISPPKKPRGGAIGLLGLTGVIISILVCYLYNSSTIFPGITAIPPVFATLLMIRWGNTGISGLILESKPFVGIGKISYSLYLWHWPLIVYWKYMSDSPDNIWGLLVVFFLSLLLAWLSWRFVEMPIRLSKSWNFKRALLWILIGCGSIGAISCSLFALKFPNHWSRYWTGREDYLERYWEGSASISYSSENNILKNIGFSNTYPEPCFELGTSENPSYLLWGDSHGMAISPGFNEFSKNNKINGIYLNRRIPLDSNSETIKGNQRILDWIGKHPEFKTIVFINRWSIIEQELPKQNNFEMNLRNLCLDLKGMNRNIIIISSIPEQEINIPTRYYRHRFFKQEIPQGISFIDFKKRQLPILQALSRIEKEGLAKILWIDNFFFPDQKSSQIINSQGFPLYYDDNHLNPTGAKELINYYNDELLRLLSPHTENTGSKATSTSPSK